MKRQSEQPAAPPPAPRKSRPRKPIGGGRIQLNWRRGRVDVRLSRTIADRLDARTEFVHRDSAGANYSDTAREDLVRYYAVLDRALADLGLTDTEISFVQRKIGDTSDFAPEHAPFAIEYLERKLAAASANVPADAIQAEKIVRRLKVPGGIALAMALIDAAERARIIRLRRVEEHALAKAK